MTHIHRGLKNSKIKDAVKTSNRIIYTSCSFIFIQVVPKFLQNFIPPLNLYSFENLKFLRMLSQFLRKQTNPFCMARLILMQVKNPMRFLQPPTLLLATELWREYGKTVMLTIIYGRFVHLWAMKNVHYLYKSKQARDLYSNDRDLTVQMMTKSVCIRNRNIKLFECPISL